jgi:hypothetical protein
MGPGAIAAGSQYPLKPARAYVGTGRARTRVAGRTQLHGGKGHDNGLPVVSALVLLGAVGFTLVAAYQWAGILGIFGEANVWNTVLAIILWLVWFYG